MDEDIFVIAGHCIRNKEDCQNVKNWSLIFIKMLMVQQNKSFNQDQIYRCSEILGRIWSTGNKNDFAVLSFRSKGYQSTTS